MSSPKYTSESSKGGRLASLNAMSRAIVLNALMKRNLSLNHKKQMLVANIFLSSYGPMMSELKDILDSGGEYHTLHKLIWQDVWYTPIRSRILKMIRQEATYIKSQKSHNPQIKIVCDMDDTLICSGGRWPAGLDRQIPRGTAYPGALQFYAAIAERTQLRFGDDSRDEDDTFPCSDDSEDSAPPSPSTRATASSFSEFDHADAPDLPYRGTASIDENESTGSVDQDTKEHSVTRRVSLTAANRASSVEEVIPTRHSEVDFSRSKSELALNTNAKSKRSSGNWSALRKKTVTYAHVAAAFRSASKSGLSMQQDDNAPFSPFKTRRKERSQSSGAQSTDNESISSASFSTEHIQRCSLYFVTARPHAYKQLSESKLLNLLKSMGGRLHCTPALTTGELHSSLVSAIRNLRALIWHNVSNFFSRLCRGKCFSREDDDNHTITKFVFATRAWRSAGVQKFRTYLQYLDLYPENRFVFVGDNGQADSYAAEIMANLSLMPEAEFAGHNKSISRVMRRSIQLAGYGQQFVAAFIHKVQAIPHTLTHYSESLKVDSLDWIRERGKTIYTFSKRTWKLHSRRTALSRSLCLR